MKKISLAFVTVLSLVAVSGCKKKEEGPPAAGGKCAAIGTMKAGAPAGAPPAMTAALGGLKASLQGLCIADKWSDATIKCVTELKSMSKDESKPCMASMTPAQKTNVDSTMKAAMMAIDVGAAIPMGAAPAMAGSAMAGSAMAAPAAGSAAPAAPAAGSGN